MTPALAARLAGGQLRSPRAMTPALVPRPAGLPPRSPPAMTRAARRSLSPPRDGSSKPEQRPQPRPQALSSRRMSLPVDGRSRSTQPKLSRHHRARTARVPHEPASTGRLNRARLRQPVGDRSTRKRRGRAAVCPFGLDPGDRERGRLLRERWGPSEVRTADRRGGRMPDRKARWNRWQGRPRTRRLHQPEQHRKLLRRGAQRRWIILRKSQGEPRAG